WKRGEGDRRCGNEKGEPGSLASSCPARGKDRDRRPEKNQPRSYLGHSNRQSEECESRRRHDVPRCQEQQEQREGQPTPVSHRLPSGGCYRVMIGVLVVP